MKYDLKIIPSDLWELYHSCMEDALKTKFDELADSELSIDTFSFYTSVSAVFSSKIEGEDIELDSYIKHKRFGVEYQPDYTRKIDDLYEAYTYAKANALNPSSLLSAHAQITKNILKESMQGKFRTSNMFVLSDNGKIEYIAVTPEKVNSEMSRFYHDLDILLKAELTFEESLFYAALIHLVFVKIHPFEDGNGRVARLLEKWFLAQKLGHKSWLVQSEKYYYNHHQEYYHNIRRLGLDYEELNYHEALPFLLMLPSAIG